MMRIFKYGFAERKAFASKHESSKINIKLIGDAVDRLNRRTAEIGGAKTDRQESSR